MSDSHIRRVQTALGVTVDGIIGPITANKAESVVMDLADANEQLLTNELVIERLRVELVEAQSGINMLDARLGQVCRPVLDAQHVMSVEYEDQLRQTGTGG